MSDFQFIPFLEFIAVYGFRTTFLVSLFVGLLAGAFGSLLYLRKQSLLSDVMGHSAIFGVVGAFIFATAILGINGRSINVLILGATIASFCSVWLTHWITRHSPISADTAMAVTLALFYGGGLCILHLVNYSNLPNRAGLSDYILGNAATTRAVDLYAIICLGIAVFIILTLLWKEIKITIFDPLSANLYGYKFAVIDPILTTCITIAIVAGVKSVGIILMVAFAILPAAICHQFAKSMSHMVLGSALIGAGTGGLGAYLSICAGSVPTGPIVVLLLFTLFIGAILFSPKRRYRLSGDLSAYQQTQNFTSSNTTNEVKVCTSAHFTAPPINSSNSSNSSL